MSRKLSLKEWREAFEKGGDLQNIECDWSELDGCDWWWLLWKQPQFADKCDWEKLGGGDWSQLLIEQPQFADKCNKWDEFESEDWRFLLSNQPQFADKCDWKKLKGDDWQKLLEAQPQFAAKYEFYFEDKWILKDQILFLQQVGDSIVVYCKGERKFDWDVYDAGALITAIDDLRKIIETLPPDDGAKLVEQGITIDTEDISLAPTLKAELNLVVWNINDYAADEDEE